MTTRVLLLGGTGEARRLAGLLTGECSGQSDLDLDLVYSLAGRVRAPEVPGSCEVRIGGFGGVRGLTAYLRTERITAVVDATHPFAAVMTASAARATAEVGVPLLVLRRPGWVEEPGDDWRRVSGLADAVTALERFPAAGYPSLAGIPSPAGSRGSPRTVGSGDAGPRVFLTTGRTDIAMFAGLRRHWFLARSVEPPEAPKPPQLTVILDRGPFDVAGETALLRRHRIDVVVTKDSGGTMTAAKLMAARDLGIPVIMIDRPPLPAGIAAVSTVEEAAVWWSRVRSDDR